MAKEQGQTLPLTLPFGFSLNTDPKSAEHRMFVEASPVSHVSPDDPPFLLIHGDADPRVFFSQSEALEAALKQVGVKVTLLRIPKGGHGPKFDGAKTPPPDYIGEMCRWMDEQLILR
jgi:dipeptidyl aminopeptidase/acylaminoacyl peptidase